MKTPITEQSLADEYDSACSQEDDVTLTFGENKLKYPSKMEQCESWIKYMRCANTKGVERIIFSSNGQDTYFKRAA